MSIWVILLLVAITGAIHDAYSAQSEDEEETAGPPPPPPPPPGVERRVWRTPPVPEDVRLIIFCRPEWDLPRTAIRGTEGWLVSGEAETVSELAQGCFWMACPKPPST